MYTKVKLYTTQMSDNAVKDIEKGENSAKHTIGRPLSNPGVMSKTRRPSRQHPNVDSSNLSSMLRARRKVGPTESDIINGLNNLKKVPRSKTDPNGQFKRPRGTSAPTLAQNASGSEEFRGKDVPKSKVRKNKAMNMSSYIL